MPIRLSLLAGIAILIAGGVLFIIGQRPPPPRTFHGSVKDLLPKIEDLPGWNVDFLPIADTPEMKAKVDEVLNYDDAVFAVYTRGSERVSIYIAYWEPGKMSHRLVAGHTPDVCWVGAGWKIEKAASVTLEPVDGGQRTVDSGRRAGDGSRLTENGRREAVSGMPVGAVALNGPSDAGTLHQLLEHAPKLRALTAQPGEYREMTLNHQTEHVVFWHLLNGVPRSYGVVGTPPWYATFTDLFTRSFDQRPEQFFIRVSVPDRR